MGIGKFLSLGFLSALLVMAVSASAAEAKWLDDFEAAKAAAEKDKKLLLVDFSGSDWCGWCIKLDKEVFSQKEFIEFAEKNLVLVLVDTPKKKALPEKVKKQNSELKSKYKIEGFPTVLIMNSKGEVVEKTGYQEGGAENYIKYLKGVIEKQKKGTDTKKAEGK